VGRPNRATIHYREWSALTAFLSCDELQCAYRKQPGW
jgi:hypothetical protein